MTDDTTAPDRPALRVAQRLTASLLAGAARAVTGVRAIWAGAPPPSEDGRQRIYFANHASHGDFILLAACLPPAARLNTRAVAAADYWGKTPTRRFIAETLLSCVLIARPSEMAERHEAAIAPAADPLAQMLAVLDSGRSLIIFPEGKRNMGEEPLLRFRSGLYNLALARPDVELVPVWIENMSRVLPKGHVLPVPLLCRVVFGAPVILSEGEDRRPFLDRAREALLALDPRLEREKNR